MNAMPLPRLVFGVHENDIHRSAYHPGRSVLIQFVSDDVDRKTFRCGGIFSEFDFIEVQSAVIVPEQGGVAGAEHFAVRQFEITDFGKIPERGIRDVQRAVPGGQQKFAVLPRGDCGAVFGVVGFGPYMAPMFKIFTDPRHTVTGVKVPPILPEEHSRITDRTVIGCGVVFRLTVSV